MTSDSLEQRVTRLERENRRLRRVNGVALAALGVAVLAAAQIPQGRVVTAQRFVLRSAGGEEQGAFEIVPGAGPRLSLHQSKSGVTLEVGALESVRLRLNSDQEGVVVELATMGVMSPHATLEMRGRFEAAARPRAESSLVEAEEELGEDEESDDELPHASQ